MSALLCTGQNVPFNGRWMFGIVARMIDSNENNVFSGLDVLGNRVYRNLLKKGDAFPARAAKKQKQKSY